jgi:hypothetical protein
MEVWMPDVADTCRMPVIEQDFPILVIKDLVAIVGCLDFKWSSLIIVWDLNDGVLVREFEEEIRAPALLSTQRKFLSSIPSVRNRCDRMCSVELASAPHDKGFHNAIYGLAKALDECVKRFSGASAGQRG